MNEKHAALVRDLELFRMKKMQAYIAIRGSDNTSENSDVPSDRMRFIRASPGRCWIIASTRRAGACCAGRRRAWPRPRA